MKNYLDLLIKCRDDGVDIFNKRTGKTCRSLIGAQLEFNLKDGFPAVTSKKLPFKSMMGELLGFFRGYTNAADFRSLGCKIWDANANETPAWLANPNRKGTDDLGRIYGAQWTDWADYNVINLDPTGVNKFPEEYEVVMVDVDENKALLKRSINQLENALRTIITNPSDRRIIVSAWNPAEFDKMALPPCHMDYRFIPVGKELNVVMTIRSWDYVLGGPYNIASTALFLCIMARLAGLQPNKVVIQATNLHIYEDHFDAVEKQLANKTYPLPGLLLSKEIRQINNLDEIAGVFTRILPDEIELFNYQCNDAIPAPMSA